MNRFNIVCIFSAILLNDDADEAISSIILFGQSPIPLQDSLNIPTALHPLEPSNLQDAFTRLLPDPLRFVVYNPGYGGDGYP